MKTVVIYGPTVTGKTDIALKLAREFQGELISSDSRQVYKGLDIGTGKVSFESRVEKHNGYWIVDSKKIHCYDLVNPGDKFSVADFLKYASTSLIKIHKLGKLPIIVGGTGFYTKALLEGVDSIGIPADLKLRQKLEKLSPNNLYKRLRQINPKRAQSMNESDRKNPRRLIRSIEIASSNILIQPSGHSTVHKNYLLIGLSAPNVFLYERADAWLETRLQKGMLEEVKNLIYRGVSPIWLESLGLEYRWLARHLQSKITLDEAKQRLKGDIHEFIRRQKTFFNQFKNIHKFDISKHDWREKLEKTVSTWYNQKNE